jgi:tetratricopeptide (TPR) repeat protein
MGSVYRARDRTTGGVVAVKILKTSNQEGVRRFEREARILARLAHPGIVGYVAHGETGDGDLFLAMEWLEGESLATRLSLRGLSLSESIALGRRVAAALGFAHASGIVHRDVKPSNIFLPGGSAERAKLVDFGIAHLNATDTQLTATGVMIGTPAYMAPEQARGERAVDARADIFSLGAVLYKCITGRPPFAAEDALGVLLKILSEAVVPPSTVRPGLPEELDRLLLRMLAKLPDERPSDGTVVATYLAAMGSLTDSGAGPMSMRAPLLTEGQRFMVCLVAVAVPASIVDAIEPALSAVADRHRATVERLDDNKWGLEMGEVGHDTGSSGGRSTVERSLTPTDLAMRAARCALAVQVSTPEARISLASGRFAKESGVPVALVDRAFDLLDTNAGSPIRIDDVTAGLLDARFEIARTAAGLALVSERGDAELGRTLLGRSTPCVGREQELVTLEATLATCVSEHIARAVLVLGAAGMGKSRLRAELLRRVRRRETEVSVWLGGGDAIGHLSSFSLLGGALRRVLGIAEGDDSDAACQKLAAALARRFAGDDLVRMIEFIGALVGLQASDEASMKLRAARRDPRLMADQLRLAWEDFVAAECARGPVLFVLEDVHWADAASIDFIDGALRRMQDGPFMVLALGRPETLDVFPGLFRSRDVQEIRLGPLSRRAAERLVREVLGTRLDNEQVAALTERADGNAFYLEELIRAVSEGSTSALPESVRAMIEARLATLDPNARRILRAASVFGQVFWKGGVQAILGDDVSPETIGEHLADLVRRELCVRLPRPRFPDDQEFGFRHALVRDAAYATLTDEDVSLVHSLAGEWLEAVGEHRGVVVAEHFERGGMPDRAVAGYLRAAEQALAGNDAIAAVRWTERAIACGASGEVLAAVLLLQAEAYNWHGSLLDAECAALAAMERLARGSSRFYESVGEAAVASARSGHIDTLLGLVPEMLYPARDDSAREEQIYAVVVAAIQLLFRALYDEADALFLWLDDALKTSASIDAKIAGPVAEAWAWRALFAGDPAAYLTLSADAVRAYEATGDIRNGTRAQLNVGYGCMQLGDYEEAERSLRDALRASERLGSAVQVVRHNLGLVLGYLGRTSEAIEIEQAALDGCDPTNERMVIGCRVYLALIHEMGGNLDQAARHVAHAVDESLAPPLRAYGLGVQAVVHLKLGHLDTARTAAAAAIELLGRLQRIDEGEAYIRLAYAETLHATGDLEGARQAINDAWSRLLERAEKITDAAVRERFLSRVPENARTAQLAESWLEV